MTRVRLQYGAEMRVEAQGHATGSPSVCAAVSCLLYTLKGWLANTEEALVREDRMADGDVCFAWSGGAGSETVMDFLMVGFAGLKETAPECITVEIMEENGWRHGRRRKEGDI